METFNHQLLNNSDISIRCSKSSNFDNAKKIVFVVHGRSEWIEKFEPLIQSLKLPDDYGWFTWDHRGQGASGGHPSHVESYDDFADDFAELVKTYAKGREYSLVSHSMGAMISLYSVLTGRIKPEVNILLSPLLKLPKEPLPHWFGRGLAKTAKAVGLGRINLGFDKHSKIPFEGNRLTHDEEKYKEILNYPFEWSGPTFGWIHATFQASDYLMNPENIKKLHTKTYVLCSSDERVVEPTAFDEWYELAKIHAPTPVEFKRFEGARHELHTESPEYARPASELIRKHLCLSN